MFDYKKILEKDDFESKQLEVFQSQSDKQVEIGGNKKGLLYLACRLAEFVLEDCADCDFAEMNFDAGIDLTNDSSSLCIFITKEK